MGLFSRKRDSVTRWSNEKLRKKQRDVYGDS